MAQHGNNRRQLSKAASVATVAGLVAAGVVFVLYLRPDWRRHAGLVGRYLLQIAEATFLKRG